MSSVAENEHQDDYRLPTRAYRPTAIAKVLFTQLVSEGVWRRFQFTHKLFAISMVTSDVGETWGRDRRDRRDVLPVCFFCVRLANLGDAYYMLTYSATLSIRLLDRRTSMRHVLTSTTTTAVSV